MTRRSRFRATCAALVLGLAPLLAATGTPAAAQEPLRIMLVGDSVTHGAEGDYTWRYRLWKHFEAAGVAVDFVGPYDGLYRLDNIFSPPTHSYVDPDFDQDHAARQGTRFEVRDVPIADLVERYHPDVIVEMLGVNDVVFGNASGAQVDQRLRDFVAEARAADPDVDLVVARAPQRWFDPVVDYNALVPGTASELTSERSRIAVAYPDLGFDLVEDTYDFAHANARGELEIAAAMADALSELGIGPAYSRPLPEVPLGPRFAPRLEGSAGDANATLSWVQSPGAQSQLVWMRDATAGEDWREVPDAVSATTWTSPALVNGHSYQFRLRPMRGYWAAADDVRSNVVTVTPRPVPPAAPSIERVSRYGVASVRWAASAGAEGYRVLLRERGTRAWRARAVTGTAARLSGLLGRRTYDVAVQAVRDGVSSLPSPSTSAAAPAPRAVSGVRVQRGRADVVRVRGSRVPEATGYRLYVRTAPTCRGGAPVRMRAVPGALRAPVAMHPVRARAVWVRLRAVRAGVLGEVGPGSTSCLRLR